MDFGRAIKAIRVKRGITQEKGAASMGIRQPQLVRWEKSGSEPSVDSLRKVCAAYGIPMEVMVFMALDGEDIPEKRREFYNQLAPLMQTIIDENILST